MSPENPRTVGHLIPIPSHLDSVAIHTLDAPDHAGGWSVDASVTIPGWDRHGLERLVMYCARPPLSQERLGRGNSPTNRNEGGLGIGVSLMGAETGRWEGFRSFGPGIGGRQIGGGGLTMDVQR